MNSAELQQHDDLVRQAEEQISAEINAKHPLVGGLLDIKELTKEYAEDDLIYRNKIHDLANKYSQVRKTRPDGNCFYRAFLYAYFESLLGNKEEYERFHKFASGLLDEIVAQGFPRFTLEDFHDTFIEILVQIGNGTFKSCEELREKVFNDAGQSDALVVYARVIVSAHLQKEQEFFANFIEEYVTVKDFCQREVEPIAKEADNIHIIALTAALGIPIRVANMDRAEGNKINIYDFPDGSTPRVHLLYRPGHYDILIPKSETNVIATPSPAAAIPIVPIETIETIDKNNSSPSTADTPPPEMNNGTTNSQ